MQDTQIHVKSSMGVSVSTARQRNESLQEKVAEHAEATGKLQQAEQKLREATSESEGWRIECTSLRESSGQLQKQLSVRTEALTAAQSDLEQLQLEVRTQRLVHIHCLDQTARRMSSTSSSLDRACRSGTGLPAKRACNWK